ncbi:hypothetical protein GCM10009547_07820 [Sporichthya brevicatena]|uniref:VOC domain-containing protein n=1 Tax=Sporichthya brevicatena TaxID=171442 RepID=A0ABN1GC06_9ACTN
MHVVSKFGYLTLGVQDMDEGVDFYQRIARLNLTKRDGSSAFLSGGEEHHWVRLEESSQAGAIRLAYEVVDEDTLTAIAKQLAERGMSYTEGGDYRTDAVGRWLRFVDPGGMEIELYVSMMARGVAAPAMGVNLEKFVHGGMMVANYDETLSFYREVLGFKISDQISNMVTFLRCGDRYHHSLVLIRSPQNKPKFDHFCVEVESIDDVMRFRSNAVRNQVPLRTDLLRHAPSGSIGVYVEDQARGLAVEFCTGHPQVDDETHCARVLPMSLETVDIWQSPLPEPAPTPALVPMVGAPPAVAGAQ